MQVGFILSSADDLTGLEEWRGCLATDDKFVSQATQAYVAGQKALAKELGSKGRWHADQMRAAHSSASQAIFSQRNAGSRPSLQGAHCALEAHMKHPAIFLTSYGTCAVAKGLLSLDVWSLDIA